MFFDKNDFTLKDERAPKSNVLNNGGIGCSDIYLGYTLVTDDVTVGDKPAYTPYADRTGEFEPDGNGDFVNKDTGATLNVENKDGEVYFTVNLDNENVSCWGLSFPFNFQGKKSENGFIDQYLFNSPYVTNDREFKSFYLTKPDGNALLVTVLGDADGWKMDYSPFQGGQVFWSLKILANFDKAYGNFERRKELKVVLTPVKSYDEALRNLHRLHNATYIYPDRNGGQFGTVINLKNYGDCDKIVEIYKGEKRELPFNGSYVIQKEGEAELIPYNGEKKGAGITLYGYKDIIELYIRTMDALDIEKNLIDSDGNLCEWQCWIQATLRLLLNYKDRLTEKQVETYERRLRFAYLQIMETDPEKAIPRRTILKTPFEDYPAFNIFKSRRLQEQFFGTSIFLDSYKYFKEDVFMEYAIGSMDSLLDNYQQPDGRLQTDWTEKKEDYTTVCAPVIPIVDMAIFLKDKDKKRSGRYFEAARKMCEYLVNRGVYFPSEGGKSSMIGEFLPDGSVMNTILNILYYCYNVESSDKMVEFARQVMDIHDNYVIKTPRCQMMGSTIRWWETLWEGDKDGPALCCGHGWTIWRAESDWLYYKLTGNEEYKIKALNGFGTNFAKIDEKGNTYSLYQTDDIVGGGFQAFRDKIKYRLAPKFPDTTDNGLSRYVWIRANDSILKG